MVTSTSQTKEMNKAEDNFTSMNDSNGRGIRDVMISAHMVILQVGFDYVHALTEWFDRQLDRFKDNIEKGNYRVFLLLS